MIAVPPTRYAKTDDGGHIAYKVLGEGPIDLVPFGGIVYNVETWFEYEPVARWWWELASFARLIMHDRRGTGLSDASGGLPNLETRASDMFRVLDEVGSDRAVVLGAADGGMTGVMAAATDPGRIEGLLWMHPQARTTPAPDWPFGLDPETLERLADGAERSWGTEAFVREFFGDDPTLTPEMVTWLARLQRHACGPSTARRYLELSGEYDVRSILPNLHVPALLFERAAAAPAQIEVANATQALMPDAELRLIDGTSSALFVDVEPILELVREFVGAERPAPALDRVLSTVLFTDIVGSTEHAAALGDAAWRTTLGEHDRIVTGAVERYRGRVVKTTGDGVLATFDGPARAVFAAAEAVRAVRDETGLELRAGVHTGEVELRGDDVAGVAVHVAARVMSLAGASELLASSTVRDLTAGSGLVFEDAGVHELKGVPGTWHLYRVT